MSGGPLAHRTERYGPSDSIPVIIEDATHYPFRPGEREHDWRDATDDEYAAYLAYWNATYDEGRPS